MNVSKTSLPNAITCEAARTLPGLLDCRVHKTPDAIAYQQFDKTEGIWQKYTWAQTYALAKRWRKSLASEQLAEGDRVAVLLRNCLEWVCFEQAALSLGLVVIPLYTTDTAENIAYILKDSNTKLLLVGNARLWENLASLSNPPVLSRVICLQLETTEDCTQNSIICNAREWLSQTGDEFDVHQLSPHSLASIVYTSGTTGQPKGVMLTHFNILWDTRATLEAIPAYQNDVFLSFLPLSHMFERTTGYYLPMMAGSCVAYSRSIQELGTDLLTLRPTVLIAVPRIYELFYGKIQEQVIKKGWLANFLLHQAEIFGWKQFEKIQGRGNSSLLLMILWPLLRHLVADKILLKMGGRLRVAVSGGAPLFNKIAHFFISMGLPLIQGYGLTEASPVISNNRLDNNMPDSVGIPLNGIEYLIGENKELLIKGPNVMKGYWNRPDETTLVIDKDGWLHTGDQVKIQDNHIYILGRIKEILVTSSGEKVAPFDMEMAICEDPLFEMAMVVGEGKPYLTALLVLNQTVWEKLASANELNPEDLMSLQSKKITGYILTKITQLIQGFPGHARIRSVYLTLEPWTIDNGLITPTLKLKRSAIANRFSNQILQLYSKHDLPQ